MLLQTYTDGDKAESPTQKSEDKFDELSVMPHWFLLISTWRDEHVLGLILFESINDSQKLSLPICVAQYSCQESIRSIWLPDFYVIFVVSQKGHNLFY